MVSAETTTYIRDERVILNGANHMEEEHFVNRVSHLPMVALTLSRLSEAYQKTKVRNALLKMALEKGEETMLTSWGLAASIANKTGLQGPLNAADSSACFLLSKVEAKLPIITYTPDEIVYTTKRMYDDTVRPRIDQLAGVKKHTVQRYNDAKQFGVDKLEEARQTAVKTVVEGPVKSVGQGVEWSLNTADALVEKLLPQGENYQYYESSLYNGNVDHARLLSHKLRQRILSRIADNARTASLLAQTLQVVDALKNTSAASSLNHLLDTLRRVDHRNGNGNGTVDSNGEVSDVITVRARALSVAKKLANQLSEMMESTGDLVGRYLPQPVTDRIQSGVQMGRDVVQQVREAHTIDELPQSLVSQVHSYVHSLHVTMNSALDVLTETYLLKWLVPEYSNIGSLDIHIQ